MVNVSCLHDCFSAGVWEASCRQAGRLWHLQDKHTSSISQ